MTERKAPTKDVVVDPLILPTNDRAIAPYRESQQLDQPASKHRLVSAEQKARGLWGAGSILVVIAALISIPFALNESRFTAAIASLMAIGFAWLASITLRMYIAERSANVSVYEGFLRCTVRGQTQDIAWDSVRSVHVEYSVLKNGSLVPTAALSLTRSDGTVVNLPRAVENPERLAQEVLTRTEQSLSKAVRMMMVRGVDVPFGSGVSLSQKGLSVQGKTWAWEHLPYLRASGPFLHIGAAMDPLPPSVVLANDVQNIHVLKAILADPMGGEKS